MKKKTAFFIIGVFLFFVYGLWYHPWWVITFGLILLSALGYVEKLFEINWPRKWSVLFLIIFLILSGGQLLIEARKNAKLEARSDFFKILDSKTLGNNRSDLKGLTWDGKNFWFTGRLNEETGLFKLNSELEISKKIEINNGWGYGLAFAQHVFLIIQTKKNKTHQILEFDLSGRLLNSYRLPLHISGLPNSFTFDGKNFWIGVDQQNMIYKLSSDFTTFEQYKTSHRLLGATSDGKNLWLTDAFNIYQYDL